MKNWMRVVLPPPISIAAFAVLYVFCAAVPWTVGFTTGFPASIPELRWPRDGLLWLTAIAYGLFRVFAFHPAHRDDYRRALLMTPWTHDKPLPCGPVQPVWQDAIVLTVLVCLGLYEPNVSPLRLPMVSLLSYLSGLTVTFALSRRWWTVYAMVFGLGLALRLWPHSYWAALVLIGLYGLGFTKLRESLKQLRVDADLYEEGLWWILTSGKKFQEQRRSKMLGWPFESLQPQLPQYYVPSRHGVMISLMAGWLMYVALAVFVEQTIFVHEQATIQMANRIQSRAKLSDRDSRTVWRELSSVNRSRAQREISGVTGTIVFGITLMLIFARMNAYWAGARSPINIWGRLLTFRWIIPRYDCVFVAPFCNLLVLGGFTYLNRATGLSLLVIAPGAVFLSVLASLNLGPRLADWKMQHPCRIMVPLSMRVGNQEYEEA